MGSVIGTVLLVVGVILLLTAILALIAPDILDAIISVLPEDRQPFLGVFWFMVNFWPLLIGGGVLVWVGIELRR